jgi:autotransporter adhesin
MGYGASATHAGGVAIGAGAQAIADPATALGNNAIASANNSLALGANASAGAANSVALGAGSVANEANTVSVGSAGNARRVTNVAAGVNPGDAVNVAQFQSGLSGVQQNFNTQLNGVQQQLNTRLSRVGAMDSAMAGVALGASGIARDNRLALSFSTYGGQTGVALGYVHSLRDDVNVSAGGAYSNGAATANVAIGFGW